VLELFNVLAHRPSAEIRRFVTDRGLEPLVRFRNLHYPEVEADFRARGGTELPALWDGQRLIVGLDEIRARLLSEKG
jgi:hypothetical protein